MTDEHTPIIKNGIAYNSESEADLAAEIPALYLDRPFDAGYVAEAVIDSKWLAAHDAQVKAEAWDEGASSRQCHCAAWSEGECGCGNWPSERNPYRAAELRADSTPAVDDSLCRERGHANCQQVGNMIVHHPAEADSTPPKTGETK